ncbi:MAG: hypothetical protein AB4911_20370 [Oscillochloridaceae bacterium umkhey_bin13]
MMNMTSRTLTTLAAVVLFFGSGVVVGVGLSNFERGNLVGGLFFTVLGIIMVWALSLKRSPDAGA